MNLASISQEILVHALTGPSETPGHAVRNTLSPHFESLTGELIRKYLLRKMETIEVSVARELISLRALLPEGSQNQLDLTAARIGEILHSIHL